MGLMRLEVAHTVEITKLAEYVDRKEDPLIQLSEHTNTILTQ